MRYTLKDAGTFKIEVINAATGAVEYRGDMMTAMGVLIRLNREASIPVARTAAEKARDRQEASQRRQGGIGFSRSK